MNVVVFALVYAAGYLIWQATHGGVQTHHFLAQSSMPGISNWWGLAVLPLLAGLTSWSVQHRAATDQRAVRNASTAAFAACLVGVALGVSYSIDKSGNTPLYVMLGVLVLSLIFRTYRPEYAFAFAIGASVDFGLVLPAIISLIPAALSATVYFAVRPALGWTIQRIRG